MLLALVGCNGEGEEAAAPNLKVCDGYTAAYYEGVVYVPKFADVSGPDYGENDFAIQGDGFRRWALKQPNDVAPAQHGPSTCKNLLVNVHLQSREETERICKHGWYACTVPGWPCEVWIFPEMVDAGWNHEIGGHCIEGYFHP